MISTSTEIPHIIKYMGSKRNIIDFVIDAIEDVRTPSNNRLYDVFGGSGVVSAAFRNKIAVTCNDIQTYTKVLSGTYLKNYHWNKFDDNELDKIVSLANERVSIFKRAYPEFVSEYPDNLSYSKMTRLEKQHRALFESEISEKYNLFVKHYSGTYWSLEQCLFIDALSFVARQPKYADTFISDVILSSLMFAMAYCTQSTGHYAQYRDLTPENYSEILQYRRREILPLFIQKFNALKEIYDGSNNSEFEHEFKSQDYSKLLDNLETSSIVYADPPYQFVHYSRFYHALETLVRYDYPSLSHKGRYREDRHQSPFCIRTQVGKAFTTMFQKTYNKNCTLVLSYSNSGMITLQQLIALAKKIFVGYKVECREIDHKHSTMGRQGDKSRNVKEAIILCYPE
jgi:adenine-specific DNA-methyltransferase